MSDFDVVGEGYEYGYDDEDEVEYEFVGDVMGAPRMPSFLRNVAARGGMVRVPKGLTQQRPRVMAIPKRPGWRADQMAPGVQRVNEGLIPLPLTALQNGGTFAAGTTQITYQGQLQKPYRPERLLVSVVRTGTSATGRLLAQLFVGTDLQQADINGFDIELFGAATAFGTRLTCKAAQPGVLIRLITTITAAPTGSDTVFASCSFAGRVIH